MQMNAHASGTLPAVVCGISRTRRMLLWSAAIVSLLVAVGASAAGLVVEEGVVVKFGPDAGMVVRQNLQTGRHVVMTSINDDSVGGQTTAASPAPGDWRGLLVETSAPVEGLAIDRLAIRYAGADGAAALEVAANYAIEFLDIANSVLGLRVSAGANPAIAGISLTGNATGIEARDSAAPTLSGSEIAGNLQFGALNLSPETVMSAEGNWWGDPTGPSDAANPGGSGDPVGSGIDYLPFSTTEPLIDCSIRPLNGSYASSTPVVALALECRNATQFRLAASEDFGATPFREMTGDVDFQLSGSAGAKSVHVQFRAATGNTVETSLPQPIQYDPGTPTVQILSPAPDAVIYADTVISAVAGDAAGIDHVEFLIGAVSLGTDTTPPYEIAWPIAGYAGQQQIRVVATSVSTATAQATRNVNVQAPAGDEAGPQVSDVRYAGVPLVDHMTLSASGTITFAVSDPSGVASVEVRFDDGQALPGGLLIEDGYAVDLDLEGIDEGQHTIHIEATDAAQPSNTTELSFIVEVETSSPPEAPVVAWVAPVGSGPFDADVLLSAGVTGADILHVRFFVDAQLLGTVTEPPFDLLWRIGGAANGDHVLQAVATNASGLTGEATRTVQVQHPVADVTGPSISNPVFDGGPLFDGRVLTASGDLSFTATDLSGVDSAAVLVDGVIISEGSPSGSVYSASLVLDAIGNGPHQITLRAVDTAENASEEVIDVHIDVVVDPGAPVVTITAPPESATITGNTTVTATAVGADIQRVDFFVDTTPIGAAMAEPYEAEWIVQCFLSGPHTLKAVATDALGRTGMDTVAVELACTSDDTTGPLIGNVRFAGQPLEQGQDLTAPGLLTFDVSDPSGVASGAVLFGSIEVTGGGISGGRYSTLLDFDGIPNAVYALVLRATDRVGNVGELALADIEVAIAPPPVPSILVPADPAQTIQPGVAVSGTTEVGSQVQLYLDDVAVGGLLPPSLNGGFTSSVTLDGEGTYNLKATAQNSRGPSKKSAPTSITYSAPSPTVVIGAPPEGAVLDAGRITVDASVVDSVGIESVTLEVNGVPLGQPLAAAPYEWEWDIAVQGEYELGVTAVNLVGKTTTATRNVTVQTAPPSDPPVQTAYTGQVQSISPSTSYGDEPITISGTAVDTSTGAVVAEALLKVVLQVNGFQRRINTSTDEAGQFSYRFVPQNSDAGTYTVSVIHPDQADLPNQGQFTINRLDVGPAFYRLDAVRTVQKQLTFTARASAGTGADGIHFVALPDDQPSGGLPEGISLDLPAAVQVPAGGQPVEIVVGFLAGDAEAAEEPSGTVVLAAMDQQSRRRATVVINYTLYQPQVALFPQPMSLRTGVARGDQVTESVRIQNRGLLPATNVQVRLIDFIDPADPGTTVPEPPAWIHLSSPAVIGNLPIGATADVQIVAAPTEAPAPEIDDGVYALKIRVSADGVQGDVPVAIAVTSGEFGAVTFLARDIYSCIPNCTTTPGMAGAQIRVRHDDSENYPGEQPITVTTDANGVAEIPSIATGRYRFVATAPSHVPATGRFTVRPGISITEEMFLDYELVTFEWSVTETTITDHYDVTLLATYETQVPAPVMLIQPTSINLPDMQEGEELTGEITITNLGLVRADNVTWRPAESDDYYQIEFLGEPPATFDARQSYRLPYVVRRKREPLPGTEGAAPAQGVAPGSAFLSVKAGSSTTATGCHGYRNRMGITYAYTCAADVERSGAASSGFNKVYGHCEGNPASGGGIGMTQIAWRGWVGEFAIGATGTPMSSAQACVPVCPDCDGGGPGG